MANFEQCLFLFFRLCFHFGKPTSAIKFARLGGLAVANILSGEARYGYETLAPWVPWSWMMLDVYSPSHFM